MTPRDPWEPHVPSRMRVTYVAADACRELACLRSKLADPAITEEEKRRVVGCAMLAWCAVVDGDPELAEALRGAAFDVLQRWWEEYPRPPWLDRHPTPEKFRMAALEHDEKARLGKHPWWVARHEGTAAGLRFRANELEADVSLSPTG